MTLRFLHWVSIKLCTSAFGFEGFPILTERKNTEKKPQNTAGNENENPAPQGSKWTDETIIRYITRALVLLIIFAWALVNLDAVLRFLGKVLALFTPFLIGGGLGTFLILLADPGKALWFVLFLLVLQQVEGNLIYPKVVGKSVGLPGLLVLMAVTIGGEAFGIFGMLFSVPVCAVLFSLYLEFMKKASTRH